MISSSGIHRAHGSQDVFDTLVTRAFGKLAGFTACFFQPCRSVGVGQLKERSAGQIRLLLNCFGGKDCFNDFVSIRPDLAGPLAEPVTVPFLIMLMFKSRLKELTQRNVPGTVTGKIAKINQVTRGWINYYALGSMKTALQKLTHIFGHGSESLSGSSGNLSFNKFSTKNP